MQHGEFEMNEAILYNICFTKSPAFFLLLVRWGQFDDFTCFNRLKAWNEK